ncbi:hypothetical protein ASD89_02665 [Caulobacter sp. Root656]|nr:hypothetical protein ASD89_02665 [Caulobacter sp. Root656]
MSTIRIDANAVSGVWARGLDSASPSVAGRQGQAFGDFSAFSRQDGALSLSSTHRDLDSAARAVSDRLTDTRDNGFG